jgi:hypothetical protein
MIPTVGRVVHYTNFGDKDGRYSPETQAAIITAVKLHNEFYEGQPPQNSEENKYRVSLHIFYATGQFDMPEVPWSEKPERGHWSWPPKV